MTSERAAPSLPGGILPADFHPETFLRDYWQKKPLLIRGGGLRDPLSPEELAGLACEDFVESRLVHYRPDGPAWQMLHGPFEEAEFADLPKDNYTLLVQAVDHWHPGVRALLDSFAFIPHWRLDDVMVSYSTPGGNVGPHYDHYDVFLIQGLGRKQWLIGDACDDNTAVDSSSGLRLLTHFQPRETLELAPGDILYLPPGLAHHGIALEAGMTYSIGFRAPSARDVLTELGQHLAGRVPEHIRYCDPAESSSAGIGMTRRNRGEIPDAAAETVRKLFLDQCLQALEDPQAIQRWFGQHMTQPRYPDIIEQFEHHDSDAAQFRQLLRAEGIHRNPASRFAYCRLEQGLALFVDGQSVTCPGDWLPLLQALCARSPQPFLLPSAFSNNSDAQDLLQALYNQGSLIDAHELDNL